MEKLDSGHGRQRVSNMIQRIGRFNCSILTDEFDRHSFKLLPNIGMYIVELMEGSLQKDLVEAWRWRPGGDALTSRRAGPARDLADMPGWQNDARLWPGP